MQKGVNPSVYDAEYFKGRYQNIDYQNLISPKDFDHIYQKAGSLIRFDEGDKIVDFGCGAGHMSFYLYFKYNCSVVGLDYSRTAIDLAEKNLDLLYQRKIYLDIKEKITFSLTNINEIPDLLGIRAVFLVDVIEHLNEDEIKIVLEKIKLWNKNKKIHLIIHTDNNNYLRFVRPVTDFISVCFGKNSYEQINKGYAEVKKGHINLTTASKLKQKLEAFGYNILKIEYPAMDPEIVKKHLGPIAEYRIIFHIIYYIGRILYFLRPSFYLLAEYENLY